MTPDILCMGEAMAEFTARPGDGDPVYVQGFGGDSLNCAVAAARHGARVGYISALGQDSFGDGILALCEREGIDASLVLRNPDAPTGVYFVDPSPAGRAFTYYRAGSAASRMTPSEVPVEAITSTRLLHVSAISQAISPGAREAVRRAMIAARAVGVDVAYDSNLRLGLWPLETAEPVIHEAMTHCDIALPSLDDSIQLTGLEEPDAIADFYLALGARIVALKMGDRGCLVATAEERRAIPPFAVRALDATGAGDAFAGAFHARYLDTGDPFAAAGHAVVAAALTTTGYGAIQSIPTADAVRRALQVTATT